MFSHTDPDSDPPSTNTWTWSGSDFVKNMWDPYPNLFVMTGQVIGATHKFELMLSATAYSGIFETLVNSRDGFRYTKLIITGTTSDVLGLYDNPPYFHLDMSDSWEILAGQRTLHTCCSLDPDNTTGALDLTHTLTWSKIEPYFPPDTTQAQ